MGTLNWTWRSDTVLGQNVLAALASSLGAAVGLQLPRRGIRSLGRQRRERSDRSRPTSSWSPCSAG
ncbi:MAG: hypothetical protein R2710_19840 [Acidimicrobiales bacterium]